VMLTGTAEPQQNMTFLREFGIMNQNLSSPFKWIEIQTTGVLMDRNVLRLLRNHVGVSTISMSVSSLNSDENRMHNQTPEALGIDIPGFCGLVKEYGFNLRLSLNMTNSFEKEPVSNLFGRIEACQANQVTFRKLYADGNTEQGEWVRNNACSDNFLKLVEDHVRKNGKMLGILEYGSEQWSFNGVSYVFDSDCMAKAQKEVLKYLVLRPNARLYTKWDDPASLLF